jgi:hypothetical protein
MVSYKKQNFSNLTNPWVGGILLIATDQIQDYVRLGLTPNQIMGWRSPVGYD